MSSNNTPTGNGILYILEEMGSRLQKSEARIDYLTRDNEMYYKWWQESQARVKALEAKLKEANLPIN